MNPFFADCIDTLERMHAEMVRALTDLDPEGLHWTPGAEMNSMAVLAAHTAGALRYWVGDMLVGDSSDRVRADEFAAEKATAADLIARLDAALEHSRQTLAGLTLDDLAKSRESPAHGRSFRCGWSLAHALEHTATHVGHMQMTRQLWEQSLR